MILIEKQKPGAQSQGWRADMPSCQARGDWLGAISPLEVVAVSSAKG